MFIITGSGHSGTGWASQFFTRLGYPCGHENYFNFTLKDVKSDSSWMAIPYLENVNCPIVRLVRDPLKVVQSFYRSNTYKNSKTRCKYTQFTYKHLPELYDTDELGRCIIRACDWDNPVENYNHITVKIEDRSYESLGDMVYHCTGDTVSVFNIEKALSEIGTKYNSHSNRVKAEIDFKQVLNHPLGPKLEARAGKFKYTIGANK